MDGPYQTITPRYHCGLTLVDEMIIGCTGYNPGILRCIGTNGTVLYSVPFAGKDAIFYSQFPK
jgi:hypothetical protein